MGRVLFTIYHSRFTRLRTYPQHTLSLLPLLRSRPGGVHKTSVVRSPKSDNSLKHSRLSLVDWCLVGSDPIWFSFFCLEQERSAKKHEGDDKANSASCNFVDR